MKKKQSKPYDKQDIANKILHFLKSEQKLLVVEYKGKRLNSIIGFEEDAKHVKIPLKTIVSILKRIFIQKPLFKILRILDGGEIKNNIYRLFGVKIGKDVFISSDVYIDDSFPELITIEDGCIIGGHAIISAHEFTIRKMRLGRVHIGKQVLIGGFSVIRSGVTIGDESVIAMDTLVNKDIPANIEVGGVPEHKIKKLKYE